MFDLSLLPVKPKYSFKGWDNICSTVWLGLSDSSGFWKINWIDLRSSELLFFKSLDNILSLLNLIWPSLVFNRPAIDFKIVDFPLPDSPTN